jgi:hypothetical protein
VEWVKLPTDAADRLRNLLSSAATPADYCLDPEDAEEFVRVAETIIKEVRPQLGRIIGELSMTGILISYGLKVKELEDFPEPDDRLGSLQLPVWQHRAIRKYIAEHPELWSDEMVKRKLTE